MTAERIWIESGDGGAALTLEPQILGDKGAIGQGQESVVRAIDRQLALHQHRKVIGVQTMEIAAIDRHDRTVGVSQDCATPHMFTAW